MTLITLTLRKVRTKGCFQCISQNCTNAQLWAQEQLILFPYVIPQLDAIASKHSFILYFGEHCTQKDIRD